MEQIFRKKSLAPALEKGIDILEYVISTPNPVSFTDIINTLNIPKATAVRLLKVLVERSYLIKDENGKYCYAQRANIFGAGLPAAEILKQCAPQILSDLCSKTFCTCTLMLWNGKFTQVIAREQHENALSMQAVGNIAGDMITTPWGWVVIACDDAYIPDAQTAVFAKSNEFAERKAFIDSNHFAFDNEFWRRGIVRLGAAVRHNGKIIALLGLGCAPGTVSLESAVESGGYLLEASCKFEKILKRNQQSA